MRKLLLTTAAFGVLGLPAMAADLAPIYKAPAPVPVCMWCGFYVGLNAGGTWGDDNSVAVNSGLDARFSAWTRQLWGGLGCWGIR